MKTIAFITMNYWKKHLKSAVALLFSGVLLTTIVFTVLMSMREECVRFYENAFDNLGHYDVLIANSNDELLSQALGGRTDCDYGVINVYGKLGYRDKQFTYGTISDERNLWHAPLDEGRMPDAANELAAVSTVLDACYWVGECGDTITLNGTEYTVVGIINERYATLREGSEFNDYNTDTVYETEYYIPLIFVGESTTKPLYRIDLIGGFFDLTDTAKGLYDTSDDIRYAESVISDYSNYLYNLVDHKGHWFGVNCEQNAWYTAEKVSFVNFLMIIAWLGVGVSVLSVFSVLRGIFIERRGRIYTLKRIGAKKGFIAGMYAFECAVFAAIQAVMGITVGLVAYGGIYFVKTSFLGEKSYSAFTDIGIVYRRTLDPFLYAALISTIIIVAAYIINILTTNLSAKSFHKRKKSRSLSNGFRAAMRQSGITAVQVISLTLICFSVIIGYMYYTDNGKEELMWLGYTKSNEDYTANGFSMQENNIEEYYYSDKTQINSFGEDGREIIEFFPLIAEKLSRGFDDAIAEMLPDTVLVTGGNEGTFVASNEKISELTTINLTNEIVRETFIDLADDEHKSFFAEGKLGSKNMYRIPTNLTVPHIINRLSEYVTDGEINPEALNSGEEILLIYQTSEPPLAVGEAVTIYSALANENGYGLGEIKAVNATVGAAIKLPSSFSKLEKYIFKCDFPCNFLTTATGAKAIGLSGAYTEVYSSEKLDGGIFPLSSEMKKLSLSEEKWSNTLNRAGKFLGIALILVVMSLLGFAAYFNGIGLKIRQKTYEISVLRALGMPISELRKRIFLSSIKIPLIASLTAYILVKAVQLIMKSGYLKIIAFYEEGIGTVEQIEKIRHDLFTDNVMWLVNAEIPTLILLTIICLVTFFLTARALKKFSRNIAEDLNSRRERL